MLSIVKKYIKEVIEECRKIVFPSWKEVYSTSIYISIVVFLTTLAITGTDFLISRVIKLIFGIGN